MIAKRKFFQKLKIKMDELIHLVYKITKKFPSDSFPGPEPNPSGEIDNKKSSSKISGTIFGEKINHSFDNSFSPQSLDFKNNHSSRTKSVETENIYEIVVKTQQNPRSFKNIIKNLVVRGFMKLDFDSSLNSEAGLPEGFDNIGMDAVVGKNSHKLFSHSEFIKKTSGFFKQASSKFDSRQDILFGDVWVLSGDFINSITSGQQIQNIGDRDSRTSDTRLTKSDFRINSDSVHIFNNNKEKNLLSRTKKDDEMLDRNQFTMLII